MLLERDPALFSYILNYLRDKDKVVLPSDAEEETMLMEVSRDPCFELIVPGSRLLPTERPRKASSRRLCPGLHFGPF